jgi:ferritin-like metal-binding protein YciE
VAAGSNEIIRRYLQQALAAEKTSEAQLREFSKQGDDEEVQAFFAAHADETQRQYERLSGRLGALDETEAGANGVIEKVVESSPKLTHSIETAEERIVQNVVIALSVESSECAMYEALAIVASAAGDTATEQLARELQAEEAQAAERLWRFIPSRSKIAYNILTAWEPDPAVETKLADNRVI